MERSDIDQLQALALKQYGLISVEQVATLGIPTRIIRSAFDRRWLRRAHQGVYAVSGMPASTSQQLMAAVLATGPKVAVSHASAAVVHGFYGIAAPQVEVTVPIDFRRRIEGVVAHRSRTLQPGDIQKRVGLPITAPIRTIIDLSSRLGDPLLGVVLDEGAIGRLWTAEQIANRLDDFGPRGIAGSHRLRRLLDLRLSEGHPDSRLEQRVYRVLRPHVPPFVVHYHEVLDGVVIDMDLAWPKEKIDGEVDGLNIRRKSLTKVERQCRRQNILAAHGWRIVHFTANMDDRTIIAQVVPLLRDGAGPRDG